MCKNVCRKDKWSEYVSKKNKKSFQMNKIKVIHRYKHASHVMHITQLVITQTMNLEKMYKNCSMKT